MSTDKTDGKADLESIGDQVTGTDLDAESGARIRLDQAGLLLGLGRLGALAIWWAGVRGEAAAGPARDVVRIVALGRSDLSQPGPDDLPGAGEDPHPGPGAHARDPAPVRTLPLVPPPDPAAAAVWGVRTADALIDAGTDLLLVSAPDLVASRVLAASLLGLDAVEVNGWPGDTGIDDRTWMHQVTRIRDGLHHLRGQGIRPAELLDALGSARLAAATGLLLRSAARRTPSLLDGSGAAAAALLAQRLSPHARDWWQVGHLGDHPVHERCLDTLRLQALTRFGITLENGTGALLGLHALDLAAGLLAGP
jgi:nicotinate-nucleotide--dimethylbenzimidazole phosphoribosyltransferase